MMKKFTIDLVEKNVGCQFFNFFQKKAVSSESDAEMIYTLENYWSRPRKV